MAALVALHALHMQPGESAGPGPDASRVLDIAGRCRILAAAVARTKAEGVAGPGRYCPPHHSTNCDPSLLDLDGIP